MRRRELLINGVHATSCFQPQHPLSDPPVIPLRFTEPPSVEGTAGGQIGEGVLEAVAVVLAACVDLSDISPGNNKGDWELPEALLVAPVAPIADPLVVGDPDAVPNCDAGEGDDTDGDDTDRNEDVGTLRGSDPTPLALLFVWPFGCTTVWPWVWLWTVWPWAAVMPINMIGTMKTSFIALSCVDCRKAALSPALLDNAGTAKKENEI
jgi:hypothetical protein